MLEERDLVVTRRATFIDFESPLEDEGIAGVMREQFELEYEPSSFKFYPATKTTVEDGLPICESEILFWRAIWIHGSETPPDDFAVWHCSRN